LRLEADAVEKQTKASEYPTIAHATPTKPREMKLIIIVLSAFFARTKPP
jgi:hypothetical protein